MVKLWEEKSAMELYYYTGPEDEQGEQLIPDNGFPSILYQIEGQDVKEALDPEKWKVEQTIGYTFWTTDYDRHRHSPHFYGEILCLRL